MDFASKKAVLKQIFGYDSFLDGQEILIDNILAGNDVLGIMPTGAGKSMCFQLPAIMFDGITLVVSPLIALMKDQVTSLVQAGVRAAFLNSSLTQSQFRTALLNAQNGVYKIIYVAPERLESELFLRFAVSANISMVTVDEAHCISQWGQDFRPNYLRITDFINKLPKRPVVSAFTATATDQVKDDIVSSLELRAPKVLVTGFDRKNLYFEVRKPEQKFAGLLAILEGKEGSSGIIYCSTRKTVDDVCEKLNERGLMITKYHAGLDDAERRKNQDDFIFDNKRIIVATNAFGMGIDKSNVSFVIHYNMPKNIESYYQEAGRAGRDGQPAECILMFGEQDIQTNLALIDSSAEKEYSGKETEFDIKQRDREKLRIMSSYCHTSECLRHYILSYFGEIVKGGCGNCSNCNDEFEEIDITLDAQKILSCIARAKERYGIKLIIDILQGRRIEKILRLGLDKLTTYGIMTGQSEKKIRDIVNYLVLNEYIFVTNDEYPVAKLGVNAPEILYKKQTVIMKSKSVTESYIEPERKTKKPTADKSKKLLNPIHPELLKQLKTIRKSLADKQNVPAFTIFADTSLIEMCSELPRTAEEFLNVNGVGQVKLERYGEEFLEAINKFVMENDMTVDATGIGFSQPIEIEFSDEPVSVSVVTDKINIFLLQRIGRKTSAQKINEWLVKEGYLYVEDSFKIPSAKGSSLGITREYREPDNREPYYATLYSRAAQQFLIDSIDSIVNFIRN